MAVELCALDWDDTFVAAEQTVDIDTLTCPRTYEKTKFRYIDASTVLQEPLPTLLNSDTRDRLMLLEVALLRTLLDIAEHRTRWWAVVSNGNGDWICGSMRAFMPNVYRLMTWERNDDINNDAVQVILMHVPISDEGQRAASVLHTIVPRLIRTRDQWIDRVTIISARDWFGVRGTPLQWKTRAWQWLLTTFIPSKLARIVCIGDRISDAMALRLALVRLRRHATTRVQEVQLIVNEHTTEQLARLWTHLLRVWDLLWANDRISSGSVWTIEMARRRACVQTALGDGIYLLPDTAIV